MWHVNEPCPAAKCNIPSPPTLPGLFYPYNIYALLEFEVQSLILDVPYLFPTYQPLPIIAVNTSCSQEHPKERRILEHGDPGQAHRGVVAMIGTLSDDPPPIHILAASRQGADITRGIRRQEARRLRTLPIAEVRSGSIIRSPLPIFSQDDRLPMAYQPLILTAAYQAAVFGQWTTISGQHNRRRRDEFKFPDLRCLGRYQWECVQYRIKITNRHPHCFSPPLSGTALRMLRFCVLLIGIAAACSPIVYTATWR